MPCLPTKSQYTCAMTRKRPPPKRSRAKKNVPQTSSSHTLWRTTVKIILVLSVLGTGFWVAWLDFQVRDQFAGRKWALPAKVYAQPLEVFEGKALSQEDLRFELKALNYQAVKTVRRVGQWSHNGNQVEIFVRAFSDGQRQVAARHIRFQLSNTYVSGLTVLSGGSDTVVQLEPALIGGVYPSLQEDRELIQLQQVPPLLGEALIAVEDRSFAQHWGVSLPSIARAALVNLQSGRVVQGGSTLTQQLVKNFFLDQSRTLSRKVTEVLMSALLEIHYSKADILEAYMNEVYLGQSGPRQIHGFGLAAKHYFGKPLQDLKPEQLALLVGLVKGASFYNPWRHPERALARRNVVLSVLQEQRLLTPEQTNTAKRAPLGIVSATQRTLQEYPAFIDLVKRQLRKEYSDEVLGSEGLKVFTTLSLTAQRRAEASLQNTLPALERQYGLSTNVLQGAVFVTGVGTGEVLAVVGDRKPKFYGFNRALDASRPIGSLVKPAVYLTALQQGYHLASLVSDAPVRVKDAGNEVWQPANFDHQSHGDVTLMEAFTHSYNQATVRLGMTIGLSKVMSTMKQLGVTKPVEAVPSLLLGTLELTPQEVAAMYHSIANDGVVMPLRAIRVVQDASGKPLSRYPISLASSLDANTVALLQYGLQGVVREGTGKRLSQVLPQGMSVAGKTGTSDGQRDSWFAGFSGQHLAITWVGRDDNQQTPLTGSSGALRVWGELFQTWSSESLDVHTSDQVDYLWIDPVSGKLSGENCRGARVMPFLKSVRPTQHAPCDWVENPVWHWMRKWF